MFDQTAGHAKSCFGSGLADEANDGVVADQGLAGPMLGDLTEETVFDGIPLGSARWVVTNGDMDAERID